LSHKAVCGCGPSAAIPPRRDDQLEFMKHISKVTKARFRQR
jgi:hypothetical protein